MKNQSVSDFVAATMDAVLNSKEHKSLFATQYKKASESMCEKHSKMDSCDADDENDARRKAKKDADEEDKASAWDDNDARRKAKRDAEEDTASADDDTEEDTEEDTASANDLEASAAFDVAIDSLLTASAALDSVGLGRGSALTLKIASLVVEAKKKDSKDKKDDKKKKDDKNKKDTQSAKDKKSNPFAKKKDDKKDDKKKPSSSKPPSSKPSSSSPASKKSK